MKLPKPTMRNFRRDEEAVRNSIATTWRPRAMRPYFKMMAARPQAVGYGLFAAWEQPRLFVEEVRAGLRSVR